ncbi:MAG: hypothetical protein WA825_09170 [Steroidobacteraceae bacterium]
MKQIARINCSIRSAAVAGADMASKGRHRKAAGLTAIFGLVALAVMGEAGAGCMANPVHGPSPARLPDPATFVPAVYRQASTSGEFLRVSDSDREDQSIVGLWQFKFDGFAPDWGTQAWHSDGTELTFSGNQDPETGDVCQGVWRQVGHDTYTLNHIAMGWLAPGAGFGIRVHLHFLITLDAKDDAFSGTYTATVYTETAANPFDESATAVVASGSGHVTATRVTPD